MNPSSNNFKKSVGHSSSGQCSGKCANLKREHATLVRLEHENIVKCDLSFFKNQQRCCLRLEQAGCDFLQYLTECFPNRTSATFSVVNSLLCDLNQAVSYIHKRNLAHNDIKLDNCLLFLTAKNAQPSLQLKLADFEYATKTNDPVQESYESSSEKLLAAWSNRNTKQMSPELLKFVNNNNNNSQSRSMSISSLSEESFDSNATSSAQELPCMKSNDIFNIGVLIFASMFGVYPFEEEASEADELYWMVSAERWQAFWSLFEEHLAFLLFSGFPQEKVNALKHII